MSTSRAVEEAGKTDATEQRLGPERDKILRYLWTSGDVNPTRSQTMTGDRRW